MPLKVGRASTYYHRVSPARGVPPPNSEQSSLLSIMRSVSLLLDHLSGDLVRGEFVQSDHQKIFDGEVMEGVQQNSCTRAPEGRGSLQTSARRRRPQRSSPTPQSTVHTHAHHTQLSSRQSFLAWLSDGDTAASVVSWFFVAVVAIFWVREVVIYEVFTKGLWASSNGTTCCVTKPACHAHG